MTDVFQDKDCSQFLSQTLALPIATGPLSLAGPLPQCPCSALYPSPGTSSPALLRPLTREPGAEVWHQRPPVGWTAVPRAMWAPREALGGLAVTEQFRTSRLFLYGKRARRAQRCVCGRRRARLVHTRALPSRSQLHTAHFSNSRDPPRGKACPSCSTGVPARPSSDGRS